MKKWYSYFLFLTSLVVLSHCDDIPENTDITLSLCVADSPIDATNVKSVNLAFSNVEKKEGDVWKSLSSFKEPRLIDLLSMSQGKYFILSNDVMPQGEDSLRVSLNMAKRGDSFRVSPKSNVGFQDESTSFLYWHNDTAPQVKLKIDTKTTHKAIILVMDIDLRKSVIVNKKGEYIFTPIMRVVRLRETGTIDLIVSRAPAHDENSIVIYIYKEGVFSDSEMTVSSTGINFVNAVASGTTKKNRLILPFLVPGSYEIIAASHSDTGETTAIFKERTKVQVIARESTIKTRLNLN